MAYLFLIKIRIDSIKGFNLNITHGPRSKKCSKSGLWKFEGARFISKKYLKTPLLTRFSSNTVFLGAQKTALEEDPLYFASKN